MTRQIIIALAMAGLVAGGCKSKSKSSTSDKAPRPKKLTTPVTPATKSPSKPRVRGRSVDWARLAQKQPKPVIPATATSLAKAVPPRPAPASLGASNLIKPTGLRIVYVRSKDEHYDAYRKVLQEERIFDTLAVALNQVIALPRTIDLHLTDCGQPDALYDAGSARIIMCYELLAYALDRFAATTTGNDELGTRVIGGALLVLFHELGHALHDQLGIPAPANAEAAADELSALLMLAAGEDGRAAAFAGAEWFALEADRAKRDGRPLPLWQRHALSPARFSNVACLLHGGAPTQYAWLASGSVLPAQRTKACAAEHTAASEAWHERLAKHLRPGSGGLRPSFSPRPRRRSRPPRGKGPPCEPVANHAARLASHAFRIEVAKLSADAQQRAREELVPQLANYRQSALLACQSGWTDKTRRCVLTKTRLAALDACAAPDEAPRAPK